MISERQHPQKVRLGVPHFGQQFMNCKEEDKSGIAMRGIKGRGAPLGMMSPSSCPPSPSSFHFGRHPDPPTKMQVHGTKKHVPALR